jgi:hypothetical protein
MCFHAGPCKIFLLVHFRGGEGLALPPGFKAKQPGFAPRLRRRSIHIVLPVDAPPHQQLEPAGQQGSAGEAALGDSGPHAGSWPEAASAGVWIQCSTVVKGMKVRREGPH